MDSFHIVVIKYNHQGNLQKDELIWLAVPDGEESVLRRNPRSRQAWQGAECSGSQKQG